MKRVLTVVVSTLVGWMLGSVIIGLGFSLLMAMAGADSPQAEQAVGALGGLVGIVVGMTYGIRTTKPSVLPT